MYVCLCHVVTNKVVSAAIEAGARDLAELGRRTGAGTECGQCRQALAELLARFAEANEDRRD
jgi:bacterioferritin-associated ferredoxin